VEISFFLAKVFGVYFMVMGALIFVRRKQLLLMVKGLVNDTPLIYVTGVLVFALGLIAVLSHNVWSGGWRTLVTVLSWLTLLKGLMYLFLSHHSLVRMVKIFADKRWFIVSGVVIILLGLYLTVKGFGGV